MVEVEGGNFLLGGKAETQITGIQIGQNLVSQELWEEVMGGNPAHWVGKERPIENISWYVAIEFCNELSRCLKLEPYYEVDKGQKDHNNMWEHDEIKWIVSPQEGTNGFRLPTEAEWEFVASGGRAMVFQGQKT